MVVRFADNAHDPNRRGAVESTVTWRFDARLPKSRAMLELPPRPIKCDLRYSGLQIHELNLHHPAIWTIHGPWKTDRSIVGTLDDHRSQTGERWVSRRLGDQPWRMATESPPNLATAKAAIV